MSKIAQRITGYSERDFFMAESRPTSSAHDFFIPGGITVRQSIRAYSGNIVGPEDLNPERENLRKNIPDSLKVRK